MSSLSDQARRGTGREQADRADCAPNGLGSTRGDAVFFSGQAKQDNAFLYDRQLLLTIFMHVFTRRETLPLGFVSYQKVEFPTGKVVGGQLAVRH